MPASPTLVYNPIAIKSSLIISLAIDKRNNKLICIYTRAMAGTGQQIMVALGQLQVG